MYNKVLSNNLAIANADQTNRIIIYIKEIYSKLRAEAKVSVMEISLIIQFKCNFLFNLCLCYFLTFSLVCQQHVSGFLSIDSSFLGKKGKTLRCFLHSIFLVCDNPLLSTTLSFFYKNFLHNVIHIFSSDFV